MASSGLASDAAGSSDPRARRRLLLDSDATTHTPGPARSPSRRPLARRASRPRSVDTTAVDPAGSDERYGAREASVASGLPGSSTLARRLHLSADPVSKVHGHYT